MLNSMLDVVTVFEDILQDEDAMLVVADLEKIVYYKAGETVNAGHVGLALNKGDGLFEAIEAKRTLKVIIPREVLGTPFKAITIPLFDENKKCVGVVGVGWGARKQNKNV